MNKHVRSLFRPRNLMLLPFVLLIRAPLIIIGNLVALIGSVLTHIGDLIPGLQVYD